MSVMIDELPIDVISVNCPWPTWLATLPVAQLPEICQIIQAAGGQLLTLWGSDERIYEQGFKLHVILVLWQQGMIYLQCDLPAENPSFSDLSHMFPIAGRLQRALFDLMGITTNADDQRPWLRNDAWPAEIFPLRNEFELTEQFDGSAEPYAFVRVHGAGVHEIPVGPVHAGIIEPGHFRFQVVGEHILRLEQRFGYTHKGIAKHFQQCSIAQGARLAGRISGDSTVAYAWAYCMAVEHSQNHTLAPRAIALRALLLERERIMNHLGDLGALGNDAGLGFALAQFSVLKEQMVRLNERVFGHRYLMDLIIPGGVAQNITAKDLDTLLQESSNLRKEITLLQTIFAEQDGLQDRFTNTGIVTQQLAERLELLGFTARASGIAHDWRQQFSYAPYNELPITACTNSEGDVAARVNVRFQEIEMSWNLIEIILHNFPGGVIHSTLPGKIVNAHGIGCVEAWRGPVLFVTHALDAENLQWAHVHDPSWQNWLALEHAVLGNIVPDFPLINKSFNLSYSGHDL